jgi:predicted HTH transcriptional regulator
MSTALLVAITAVAFLSIGMYLTRRKEGLVAQQSRQKALRKEKVLAFLDTNDSIRNNDVEKLTGVSNATAERYLSELEKEGKLVQHGTIGKNVFYTKK